MSRMKKVGFYLLGLALLMLALMGLHLKELYNAAIVEKNKIDQQIASTVCTKFEQIASDLSHELDVRDCADLGNGSFLFVANTNRDQLHKTIRQQLQIEDPISYPYHISIETANQKNDVSQSELEFEDKLQTAVVNIDVPPLRNIILSGWGLEFMLILIISSIMIWIYYNIIVVLNTDKSSAYTAEVNTIQIGNYSFDAQNQALSINDTLRRITAKECQVLNYLYSSKNQIVRRDDILMALWGDNDYFKGRSLDVFIARLRKHLSEDHTIRIETVHGVGFILTDK